MQTPAGEPVMVPFIVGDAQRSGLRHSTRVGCQIGHGCIKTRLFFGHTVFQRISTLVSTHQTESAKISFRQSLNSFQCVTQKLTGAGGVIARMKRQEFTCWWKMTKIFMFRE
jgi:hypothetical protein